MCSRRLRCSVKPCEHDRKIGVLKIRMKQEQGAVCLSSGRWHVKLGSLVIHSWGSERDWDKTEKATNSSSKFVCEVCLRSHWTDDELSQQFIAYSRPPLDSMIKSCFDPCTWYADLYWEEDLISWSLLKLLSLIVAVGYSSSLPLLAEGIFETHWTLWTPDLPRVLKVYAALGAHQAKLVKTVCRGSSF